MRSVIAILLDLIGIAVLSVGGWWLAPWVGMFILGAALMAIAWAIDPPKRASFDLEPEEEPAEDAEPQAAVAPPGLEWGSLP